MKTRAESKVTSSTLPPAERWDRNQARIIKPASLHNHHNIVEERLCQGASRRGSPHTETPLCPCQTQTSSYTQKQLCVFADSTFSDRLVAQKNYDKNNVFAAEQKDRGINSSKCIQRKLPIYMDIYIACKELNAPIHTNIQMENLQGNFGVLTIFCCVHVTSEAQHESTQCFIFSIKQTSRSWYYTGSEINNNTDSGTHADTRNYL